jgi:hypothetical protein
MTQTCGTINDIKPALIRAFTKSTKTSTYILGAYLKRSKQQGCANKTADMAPAAQRTYKGRRLWLRNELLLV